MKMNYRQRGFTLIELLVIIAIIGILATVIVLNMGKASAKGRDAKRKDDISQIARALKMYYAEKGSYPSTSIADNSYNTISNWLWLNNNVSLQPYLANLPIDPKNNNLALSNSLAYRYLYRLAMTTGSLPYDWFTVYALRLENTSDRDTCKNGRVFGLGYQGVNIVECSVNLTVYKDSFGITSNGK